MRDIGTLAGRLGFARDFVADLTSRELDRLADLHQGHVWAIENGKRDNVESETVCKLAAALGLTVGWLLGNEGRPPRKNAVRAAVAHARVAQAERERLAAEARKAS